MLQFKKYVKCVGGEQFQLHEPLVPRFLRDLIRAGVTTWSGPGPHLSRLTGGRIPHKHLPQTRWAREPSSSISMIPDQLFIHPELQPPHRALLRRWAPPGLVTSSSPSCSPSPPYSWSSASPWPPSCADRRGTWRRRRNLSLCRHQQSGTHTAPVKRLTQNKNTRTAFLSTQVISRK